MKLKKKKKRSKVTVKRFFFFFFVYITVTRLKFESLIVKKTDTDILRNCAPARTNN